MLHLTDRALYPRNRDRHRLLGKIPHCPYEPMDFDQTLGFPGEGPFMAMHTSGIVLFWFTTFWILGILPGFLYSRLFRLQIPPLEFSGSLNLSRPRGCSPLCRCCGPQCFLLGVLLIFASLGTAEAMPILPRTPAENRRMNERFQRPELASGRPVTEATSELRRKYWEVFQSWTTENGYGFAEALEDYRHNIEEINMIVVRFGRALYRMGKSYNQYAETINSLVAQKPGLRRMMTAAWDLGFAWSKQEPSQHHAPIPVPILLAMLVTCLSWGWSRMAGMLALGFGGLLRPGELMAGKREDLLLPRDTGHSVPFAVMSIKEPKSRFTYARHQATKIDSDDLVQVLDFAFSGLRPCEPLWPYSSQTFRNRFKSLLTGLSLSTVSEPGNRCLDPGSLRSGGATYIILMTENSELCRRRGRCANHRMMEVYVQEVTAIQYMSRLKPEVRQKIIDVASYFQAVFQKVKLFSDANIPENAWFLLLSR